MGVDDLRPKGQEERVTLTTKSKSKSLPKQKLTKAKTYQSKNLPKQRQKLINKTDKPIVAPIMISSKDILNGNHDGFSGLPFPSPMVYSFHRYSSSYGREANTRWFIFSISTTPS